MSSKQSGQNGVIGRVLDSVRPARQTNWECMYCGLSYDSDRLNCPACGGPVDQQ